MDIRCPRHGTRAAFKAFVLIKLNVTAVPEKDENVGIFFGVDSVVTKSGIELFFNPLYHRSCPIIMQTRSDSARASPDNNNDDIYASDRAMSPFETTPNDSDTLIGEPLSGR